MRALYDDEASHTPISRYEILVFWPPSCHPCSREMAAGPWQMRRRRGRCSVFAVHPASGQLPRVARTAARRAQGPLSGPFGKAYCGVRWWHRERDKIDKIILLAMAQCPVGCGAFDFRGVLSPEGPGSDTSSGCLAQHRGPFSSKDQRQEAKR